MTKIFPSIEKKKFKIKCSYDGQGWTTNYISYFDEGRYNIEESLFSYQNDSVLRLRFDCKKTDQDVH